jgi:DHA2 family multidrug resistance protein-like MFS transporter
VGPLTEWSARRAWPRHRTTHPVGPDVESAGRRLTDPPIDLHLFRVPTCNTTVVTLMVNSAVMFAASLFTAQYLQLVLGRSPAQAGLWTLPGVIAVLAGSQQAPRLLRWGNPNAPMVAGTLGGGVAVSRDLPAEAGGVLLEAARGAFGDGYLAFAGIDAALMLVAAGVLAAVVGGMAPPRGHHGLGAHGAEAA